MQKVLNQVIAQMTATGQMFEMADTEVHGNKMKTWVNAPNSLRDVWLSTTKYADQDYLVYDDERWTYQQAHDAVARIANWLSTHGIKQHDRVAIALRNYPEWMLSYWAITSIGAVVVGINAWWVADELKHGLKDCDAKLLICDAERLNRFSEIREEFAQLSVIAVRVEEVPSWAKPWNDVLEAEAIMPEANIDTDDDACIFYTSGTTGFPKGAQLTHRNCTNHLFSYMFGSVSQGRANTLIKGELSLDQPDPNALQPSALVSTPLFHVTANNGLAHTLTANGGKLVHMYKWDAGEALRLIEKEKITSFSGVPTMGRELINHPDFDQRDLSSLKQLGGGGAPVPPDLINKINNRVASVTLAQGYGLTEACGVVSASNGIFLLQKPNSAGIILPVCEMKTINEQGKDLPRGETGEICIYGPHIVKGYLNRPKESAETIVDGWLRSGDIGFIDEDNFVFLVDRVKDMVLRGGENVYCSEVEAAMYNFPNITECCVFSVPDERLGEEVGAAIFAAENSVIDIDKLRHFMKSKVAAFKVPRYIWILDQPLPRNATGKFVKRELQAQLKIDSAHQHR